MHLKHRLRNGGHFVQGGDGLSNNEGHGYKVSVKHTATKLNTNIFHYSLALWQVMFDPIRQFIRR